MNQLQLRPKHTKLDLDGPAELEFSCLRMQICLDVTSNSNIEQAAQQPAIKWQLRHRQPAPAKTSGRASERTNTDVKRTFTESLLQVILWFCYRAGGPSEVIRSASKRAERAPTSSRFRCTSQSVCALARIGFWLQCSQLIPSLFGSHHVCGAVTAAAATCASGGRRASLALLGFRRPICLPNSVD